MKNIQYSFGILLALLPLAALGQESASAHPVYNECREVAEVDAQRCFFEHITEAIVDALVLPKDLQSEGRVFVELVFDESGRVDRAQVLRSFDPEVSKAVLEAVKKIPPADQPAIVDGRARRVKYVVPVNVKLR